MNHFPFGTLENKREQFPLTNFPTPANSKCCVTNEWIRLFRRDQRPRALDPEGALRDAEQAVSQRAEVD